MQIARGIMGSFMHMEWTLKCLDTLTQIEQGAHMTGGPLVAMYSILAVAAVSWSSKKQPTIALSSTEAEYKGAAMATCEIAWLHKLLQDLGQDDMKKVTLHCDNMSSIQLENNLVFHARTKHIEVHYHYVHEKVLAGHVDLVYVSTEEQVADIFTKCLGAKKLNRFRSMMGVQEYGLSLRGSVEISSSTYDSPG